MGQLPKILDDAILQGVWKNPGSLALRILFGSDLPDMELFESASIMHGVREQIENSGYVDDPEFCFVRHANMSYTDCDPRLIFERALFLGGSTIPGDDVFIAADLKNSHDPHVFLFDWERPVPNRWALKGTLENLIFEVSKLPTR